MQTSPMILNVKTPATAAVDVSPPKLMSTYSINKSAMSASSGCRATTPPFPPFPLP